jgi:hypothetical protein
LALRHHGIGHLGGAADGDTAMTDGRDTLRREAKAALGGPWPKPPGLNAEVTECIDKGDYRAEKVRYQVEPDEWVSAWVLIPSAAAVRGGGTGLPAIAVWHQHNDEYHLGKSESAGFSGDASHHTGPLLASQGYVVICPDALGFEDRRHPTLDGRDYERHMFMYYLVRGRCLAWKNILDCRRALDYLSGRPEVDQRRMGCYGHSLGSTFAWLTGPWDQRLKCIVGNCCMPSMDALEGAAINHSFSNYIPGLKTLGDLPGFIGLIAPRRLHLNFGAFDPLNPIEYVERELSLIAETYRKAGAEEAFSRHIDPDAGHELSESMKTRMLEVFRETL